MSMRSPLVGTFSRLDFGQFINFLVALYPSVRLYFVELVRVWVLGKLGEYAMIYNLGTLL
jgi:hypothetical protein